MQDSENGVFPVALGVRDRAVLLLGGEDEATQKAARLLAAGARVTVVADAVTPELERLARVGHIRWFAREFSATDLAGAFVVLLTLADAARARDLRGLARRRGFLLCCIDQPEYSDFFLMSLVDRFPVQIAISTGGRAPLLARRIRQALDRAFDAKFGEFARNFAALRADLRRLPKVERSELLERALSRFAMEVRLSYPESEGHPVRPPDEARER